MMGEMGKRIDVSEIPPVIGTLYPAPFDRPCRTRERKKLGDAAGLTQFGLNLLRLPPGAWSSQRHWHSHSDEFIYVLAGEVVLVINDGEEVRVAETPPVSKPATQTAIAFGTNQTATYWSSK